MHPQVQAWHDAFAAAPADARRLCAGLDGVTFNAAPAAGAWSVGQCLDHLLRVGGPLVERLDAAITDLRQHDRRGAAPYALGFVGGRFARSNGPGGRTVKTPGTYRPAETVGTPEEVLAAFASLNQRLGQLVELGDGLALDRVRVASPALAALRLNVAAWLETTALHQQRHLAQAQRVRAALGL